MVIIRRSFIVQQRKSFGQSLNINKTGIQSKFNNKQTKVKGFGLSHRGDNKYVKRKSSLMSWGGEGVAVLNNCNADMSGK